MRPWRQKLITQNLLRFVVSLIFTLGLVGGVLQAPSPAIAAPVSPAAAPLSGGCPAPDSAGTVKGRSMKKVIAIAKKRNAKALRSRVALLRKSSAFVSVVKHGGSKKTLSAKKVTFYLTYFAAVNSAKQVKHLVKVTKGKRFLVTGGVGTPRVRLVATKKASSVGVDSADVSPAGISCWQGWVAFWAWWVAAEVTCAGFGAMVAIAMVETGPVLLVGGYIATTACAGLFAYLSAQFIDFNKPCNSPSSVLGRADPIEARLRG